MPPSSSPESRIVAALEAAAEPLEREQLRERVELTQEEFDATLARLRGQEVVRKLPDTDAYRITYWPTSPECLFCDDEITGKDYYELELHTPQGSSTEKEITGILHPDCARKLFDELSHSPE